jgi:hypothetical protein
MPARTLLSSEQRTRLFSIPTDPPEMVRHYILGADDLAPPCRFEIGDVLDGHDRASSINRARRAAWIRTAREGSSPNPRAYSRRSNSATMLEGAGDSE